jgi:ribonuclease BN (tRNA processing enzyme)
MRHVLGLPLMRLTVLGGCGAEAGQACSGFLVEHDGFRLLVDLGYATVPRLLQLLPPEQVDAAFISHRHPDHCADLNPLLRARALRDDPAPTLPVYALPGALDAVLALDRPEMLAESCTSSAPAPACTSARSAREPTCSRTLRRTPACGWPLATQRSCTPVTAARART